MGKRRVFFDIDGTMAKWTQVDAFEDLLQLGFYANLATNPNVIAAAKILKERHGDELEIFSLSAYLEEHPCAVKEKNEWLDKHVAEIPTENRLFCVCGTDKREVVPGGIRAEDLLVDDYTVNLSEWAQSAKAIKLLNGINGTKGTWRGKAVSMFTTPDAIAEAIYQFAIA